MRANRGESGSSAGNLNRTLQISRVHRFAGLGGKHKALLDVLVSSVSLGVAFTIGADGTFTAIGPACDGTMIDGQCSQSPPMDLPDL